MKRVGSVLSCALVAIVMGFLIFQSKSAAAGVTDGITLCLYTVIPALFPFCVFSKLINQIITGRQMAFLRPVGRICGIPAGCESLLVLGLLGGYPVGASTIYDAYTQAYLSKNTARRLLTFCNNAGPSFIFGLMGSFFTNSSAVWCLWMIQIVSALLVGLCLPKREYDTVHTTPSKGQSFTGILQSSIKTMSIICGYVILFRTILNVCSSHYFSELPDIVRVLLSGILELTNGCCLLNDIPQESLRFVIACTLLSWGGLCVLMQTAGVTGQLGVASYVKGKIAQTGISLILSGIAQRLLYPYEKGLPPVILAAIAISTAIYILYLRKNSSKVLLSVV